MKEHLMAKSPDDVGAFYDPKYKAAGLEAFTSPERHVMVALLIRYGANLQTGSCALDACCGSGEFLAALPQGVEMFGFDVSTHATELAQFRLRPMVADIRRLALENLMVSDFAGKRFDVVTCFGAIEHTMHPLSSFITLISFLKPGGTLLVTVPLEFDGCLDAIRAEENQVTNERFAGVQEWLDLFSRNGKIRLQHEIVGDGERKDLAIIYRKEN